LLEVFAVVRFGGIKESSQKTEANKKHVILSQIRRGGSEATLDISGAVVRHNAGGSSPEMSRAKDPARERFGD
jgi:hypothetical protein